MNDKVYLAKLGKAVGLKGHLRLFIDSDFPEQFKKNATFTTNKNLELKISEYISLHKLVKFVNYEDIDSAKKLTNQELFTSQEDTKKNCKLKQNEYFWFDLINCEIMEDGKILGMIKDINRYPLDDYFEVETSFNLVESGFAKSFLIPYIPEVYILKVDLTKKVIQTKSCFDILENS